MKSRRVRTLSSNIAGTAQGTVSKKAPVPSPASPTKSRRSIEIEIDEETPSDIVEIEPAQYDPKKVIKDFEAYNTEYFDLVMQQVLKHQALRTAISQVGSATTKEFNNSFVLLDTETDEAISEIFKLNFLVSVVEDLSKKFHTEFPLPALEVCRMLFSPEAAPAQPKKPTGLDSKKLIEQLGKLVTATNVGPYGMNRNDKPKS